MLSAGVAGQVKEMELPLEGIMLQGAERDAESKAAKSQHGPDFGATQELLKEPKRSTARGLAAVEKLWPGKENRDGHVCLVWSSQKGERWSLWEKAAF